MRKAPVRDAVTFRFWLDAPMMVTVPGMPEWARSTSDPEMTPVGLLATRPGVCTLLVGLGEDA
jgi:hypothetical protein